jgi:hypothetical protein
VLRVGEVGQQRAAAAEGMWRIRGVWRRRLALCECGSAIEHPVSQRSGYLAARGIGRRAVHVGVAGSLGTAITKPR